MNEPLRRLLVANSKQEEDLSLECIPILHRDNFPVDPAAYASYEHNPARGGWKELNYLITIQ
jgi:3',5'-nucleoside bisphosphate phosphatase